MNEDYGLPEVELKPIDRANPVVPAAAVNVKPSRPKKKEPTNYGPIILIALIASLIVGGVFYYFFLREPAGTTNTNEITQNTTPPDRLPLDASEGETAATKDTDNATETNSDLPNLDQPGTITAISERTGRYYIFLGSYKFRAYAKRHADRLAKDGFAVKLIDQDNWVGLRVAVGNYGSENEALADAASINAKYGIKTAISQY